MSHTNEPWPVFTDIATTMTPDPEGTPVAILSWDDYTRARACVNACAGIPTGFLESEQYLNTASFALRISAEKQRDDLLSALEQFFDPEGNPPADTGEWRHAKHVIASVKGLCGEQKAKSETQADLSITGETQAAIDLISERIRQISAEGWTPEHDDQHKNGELPLAAGLYAISAGFASKYLEGETKTCPVPDGWPWAQKWWKPANARRDLVKAGALILAEIERLDRAETIRITTSDSAKSSTPAIASYPCGSLGSQSRNTAKFGFARFHTF